MGQKATTSTSTSLSCPHSLSRSQYIPLSHCDSLALPPLSVSVSHPLSENSFLTAYVFRCALLCSYSCVCVCVCLTVCGSYEVILCLLCVRVCVYVRSIECDGNGVRRTATLTTAQNEEHENKVRIKKKTIPSLINGKWREWKLK